VQIVIQTVQLQVNKASQVMIVGYPVSGKLFAYDFGENDINVA
jgi:hypothetical protein